MRQCRVAASPAVASLVSSCGERRVVPLVPNGGVSSMRFLGYPVGKVRNAHNHGALAASRCGTARRNTGGPHRPNPRSWLGSGPGPGPPSPSPTRHFGAPVGQSAYGTCSRTCRRAGRPLSGVARIRSPGSAPGARGELQSLAAHLARVGEPEVHVDASLSGERLRRTARSVSHPGDVFESCATSAAATGRRPGPWCMRAPRPGLASERRLEVTVRATCASTGTRLISTVFRRDGLTAGGAGTTRGVAGRCPTTYANWSAPAAEPPRRRRARVSASTRASHAADHLEPRCRRRALRRTVGLGRDARRDR